MNETTTTNPTDPVMIDIEGIRPSDFRAAKTLPYVNRTTKGGRSSSYTGQKKAPVS